VKTQSVLCEVGYELLLIILTNITNDDYRLSKKAKLNKMEECIRVGIYGGQPWRIEGIWYGNLRERDH
jgi:hypothetical protein